MSAIERVESLTLDEFTRLYEHTVGSKPMSNQMIVNR